MKNLILIISVLALAGAASAQQYNPVPIYTQGTNAIAGSATVTPATTAVVVTKFDNVAFQFTAHSTADATNAVTANFAKSVDGVTYETTPSVALPVTLNGTNAVSAVTNLSTGAVGYLKLKSIVNSDTNAVSGASIMAVKKYSH